ncbi:MAG: AbgT family transporter [Polyangiaceae bacterium]|nr:AbgT family transporter [Polyangiaceae bacterium]
MSTATTPHAPKSPAVRTLKRLLNLPARVSDASLLLGLVLLGIGAVSWLLARRGVTAPLPTGAALRVESLFSRGGLSRVWSNPSALLTAVQLGTVFVGWFGVRVAEQTGLLRAIASRTVSRVPAWGLSFAAVFTSILTSGYGDTPLVAMPALWAALFLGVGRHPLAGASVSFAGCAAGFGANVLVSRVDVLLAQTTQSAAQAAGSTIAVSPAANYWFAFLSAFVVSGAAVFVASRWVDPLLSEVDVEAQNIPLTNPTAEARALVFSAIAAAVCLVGFGILLALPSSPLRDESGSPEPFFAGLPIAVAVLFALPGWVFGRFAREPNAQSPRVSALATGAFSDLGSYLLPAFMAALVIVALDSTNLATVLIIKTSRIFKAQRLIAMSGVPLYMILIVYTAAVNFLVPSASAKWALLAPVVVPAAVRAGHSPESAQAAFRIGDSTTNILTPVMPYTVAFFALIKRYYPKAHAGTLAALTLPFTVTFLLVWSVLFGVFFFAGLPFGPG